MSSFSPIITTSELSALFGKKSFVLLDARSGALAKERYLEKHLKGAYFIDLETELSPSQKNPKEGGRHPLPSLQDFEKVLRKLGIEKGSHVVIYDEQGGANAAARVWWMLKSVGLEKVQVLSGAFIAALEQGLPTNSGNEPNPNSSEIEVQGWELPLSDLEEVREGLRNHSITLIDVRENFRYRGEKEPIDVVAGHIPGAVNRPYLENLEESGLFLPPEELKDKYEEAFEDPTKKVVVHCGSGVTACHTLLAFEAAGLKGASLYVGSWSEWSRNNLPVAKG